MEEIKKENIFKRIVISLGRHEFRVFVFFLFILILSWPFAIDKAGQSLYFPFAYFFSAWLLLVVFLLASHLRENKNKD